MRPLRSVWGTVRPTGAGKDGEVHACMHWVVSHSRPVDGFVRGMGGDGWGRGLGLGLVVQDWVGSCGRVGRKGVDRVGDDGLYH